MTQYLISFDSHAMDHVPDEEGPAVGSAARAVVQEAKEVIGGLTVVEVPSLAWAAKVAAACRCAQEVRVFQPGPDV